MTGFDPRESREMVQVVQVVRVLGVPPVPGGGTHGLYKNHVPPTTTTLKPIDE